MADEKLDPDYAIDDRIFHYTSAVGLYGILSSECLWATHFQFLNDSKEFIAVRESLVEFVKGEIHKRFAAWKVNRQVEIKAGTDLRELASHEAEVIVSSLYDVTYGAMGDPFVLSGFRCTPSNPAYTSGGLLHWAMYGPQRRRGVNWQLGVWLACLKTDGCASRAKIPLTSCPPFARPAQNFRVPAPPRDPCLCGSAPLRESFSA